MRRGRWPWIVVIGTMMLVAGLGGVRPGSTDAAFTDTEHAAAGQQFGTVVLEPPVVVSTSCTRPSLLTLTRPFLTVTWRWPQAGEPYTGFAGANTLWVIDGKQAQATTTGPDANGVFTTVFTGALLQQLLGSITDLLLGSSFTVSARTIWTPGTAEWRSDREKVVSVSIPPLAGISCPNPDA